MTQRLNYTNHSGGASGADLYFEIIGVKYGIKTIAYSFPEHRSVSRFKKPLNTTELLEGWWVIQGAAKNLKRNLSSTTPYVKKLIARDWFQVKNSKETFAIGKIIEPMGFGSKYQNKSGKQVVDGGTGYAVEMSIENNHPVHIFNLNDNTWYQWDYKFCKFIKEDCPILCEQFAGIGTRNLNRDGEIAIEELYKKSFL